MVGAGPVGATVANFLGLYGVETVLIERCPQVIDYPRAVGMDDECLRSLQAVGLADELAKDMIQNVPLRFFDARGRCFADVPPATREYGWSRRPGRAPRRRPARLPRPARRQPHQGHRLAGLRWPAPGNSPGNAAHRGPRGSPAGEWFTRHTTRFAVIRPDRYVAALCRSDLTRRCRHPGRSLLEPSTAGRNQEKK